MQKKLFTRQSTSLFALLLLSPIVAGCGGSGHNNTANLSSTSGTSSPHAKGKVTLSVTWPKTSQKPVLKGLVPHVIPAATQSVLVEVIADGKVIQSGTIDRSSGITGAGEASKGTLTLNNVPVGNVTIRAKAYPVSGGGGDLLASGESIAQILPTDSNVATVNLTAVPPPVTNDTYVLGGSVSPDPANPGQINITLSALINRTDGTPVTGLTADNFVVLEDGIQRSPLVVNTAGGIKSKADIAFAIDTTGSMSPEIDGVKNSVIALTANLQASGIDVRLAGDQFGDDIRGVFDFTSNPAEFQSWVQTLNAEGGGDTPENSLNAITKLSDSLTWRPDAQHIIIVITDAVSHQAGDGTDFTTQTSASVSSHLAGTFVVDAISPGSSATMSLGASRSAGKQPQSGDFSSHLKPHDAGVQPLDVEGVADATGGRWIHLPSDGAVDLSALPISQTILNGYVVSYPSVSTNTDHQIRIVVSIGGTFVADQNFTGHY